MSRLLTNLEFIKKLSEKRNDVINIDNYIGSEIKIKFRCLKCKHEWDSKPSNILSGKGCPNCSRKKTNEFFLEELKNINNDIIATESYIKDDVKMKFKCKKCQYEWYQTPNNILNRKCGCPICAIKKINDSNTLSHSEFLSKKYLFNKDVEITGIYIKNKFKLEVKCLTCGYEWKLLPSNILKGQGCPKCMESHLEQSIYSFLDLKKIIYERQKKFDWLGRQSLDFYLPDYNIAIECQGEQHFKPVKHFGGYNRYIDTINRDLKKKILCNDNNINIIYVYDNKFNKNINDNQIISEVYENSTIIDINHLYEFWK